MKLLLFISVFILATLGLDKVVEARDTSLICGDSTSSKKVSMVAPNSPPNLCEYTIEANSKSMCQMRVDFSISMAQPEFPTQKNHLEVPECTEESVSIGDFVLCGNQTNQHIYVPVSSKAGIDTVKIMFNIAQRKGTSKLPPLSWDVKVTQLECPAGVSLRKADTETRKISAKDGYLLAPAGCDQYYPDDKGTIQSFNYNDGKGIYPYNLEYVLCFRRTIGTTGLLIQGEDFRLGQEQKSLSFFTQIDTHCYPQKPTNGRVEDYLMIPQAIEQENTIRATYFCGQSLNGADVLSETPGPLLMIFKSGSVYQNITSLGFSLKYEIVNE